MSVTVGTDTAKTRRELEAGGSKIAYYSIPAAEEAGLRADDVVLSIDRQNVEHARYLSGLVGKAHADRKVPVEIWREGAKTTVEVFLGVAPADPGAKK